MKWNNKLEEIFRHKRSCQKTHETNHTQGGEQACESHIDPLPINFYFKALVVTDGHGCLDYNDTPNDSVDACLLLGDLSLREIEMVKRKVKDTPIYGVLGNHDGFELYDMCGIENIHGKVVEVNGVRIAGIQGSLRYKNAHFPFYTDEESVEIAEKLEEADILISHDGPKYFHGDQDWAHSGLQGITRYCEKYNVPANIHGHFHENVAGVLENGTNVVCCYGAQIIEITPSGIRIGSK